MRWLEQAEDSFRERWARGRGRCAARPKAGRGKNPAFFVHSDWARRGVGSAILGACEAAAEEAGFARFEMGATLTGVPLYLARGYRVLEQIESPLANGELLPIAGMAKDAMKEVS